MSGLVDIWTAELAKLRNKSQAVVSSTEYSAPTTHEAASMGARADENISGSPSSWLNGLAQALRVNKLLGFQCSEASLSMLVESFSA